MSKNKNAKQIPASATTKAFQLPYSCTCSKCGAKKAVRHEVLLKRMQKFAGSVQERHEALSAVYLCQDCRREAKMAALEAAGVFVAVSPADIGAKVKEALSRR